MSENLSILDGELRRQFAPVDRLSMDNQGGGESRWVVADFLDISTLDASENGLYLAAEDDCDCYEEVEVEVSAELEEDDYRKITGIDPVDGNPYEVGVDAEGNLTKEMLPSSIHIVVPPWKREYENGEEINFYGMHVYLLDKDGHPFKTEQYPTGEIPFEELMLPVTIADGSEQSGQRGSSDLFPDGVAFSGTGVLTYRSTYGDTAGQTFTETLSIDGAVTLFMFSVYSWGYLFASKSNTAIGTITDSKSGESSTIPMYDSITHNGKTAYFTAGTVGWGYAERDVESVSPSADPYKWNRTSDIAWTMLYGNITGGGQEIPVQWMRSDGEMLSDSFYITVTDSGSDTNNSSTNSGTSDSGSGHTSGGF